MNACRRAGTKETVLICVAVVILLAAVYMWTSGSGESIPKGAAKSQSFRCVACGAVFELTPDEIDRQLNAPRVSGGRSDPEARAADDGPVRFVCKKCRKRAAVPEQPLAGPPPDAK